MSDTTNPWTLASRAAAATRAARSTPGYRGPQVCAIVGITYRQLDYWARSDLLRPSISEAHGSGTQRRYSHRDLIELAVIRRLLDSGISLQSVRRAITHLRDTTPPDADITHTNLVIAGNTTHVATTGQQIVELLRTGHGVLNIVPLAGITQELDAAITQHAT